MAAVSIRNSTLFADANLQAYWELENVNDSKNSYTLTNNGSGSFASALFSNGYDQGSANTTKYLSRTDAAGISSSSTAFTIMGWIKLRDEIASGSWLLFWDQVGSTVRQNYIQYEYNGGTRRLRFNIYHNSGGDTDYFVTTNATLGTSNWHLLAFTFNGSNLLEAFYDGSSVGTAAATTTSGSATSPSTSIGSLAGSLHSSALFDDWAIFNRALTSTEIANHYSGADALPSGGNGVVAFFMR